MTRFVHLQTHSEYSMLQALGRIPDLIQKAKDCGHEALALTDHGNMFGALEFYTAARKAGIKPLLGCDLFMAPDRRSNLTYLPGQPSFHKILLLAQNETGYKNLLKIVSDGYIDGYFQKPRIDRESLTGFSEGLLCICPNHQGELGHHLLRQNEKKAREVLDFLLLTFGRDNLYLGVANHGVPDEEACNRHFLALHEQEGLKLVALNDIHFTGRDDFEAHEILLCIEGGYKIKDPDRNRFPSADFHYRTTAEMEKLFAGYPGAIANTAEIADRCNVEIEFGKLYHPVCPLPAPFDDADEYLAHLSREGLKTRYAEVTPELAERLEFELVVMKRMKVAGYMLIVQDFINAAKDMGIPVGPGRGSAVGSLVSYAIGITDVDPIRYKLLFERFLNPERVSMPDIDTDFSDNDRGRVIQYVVDKYGKDSVAQIVTYGRMKAKMVLRDVGRVLGFEASRLNFLCKLFPPNNPFADLEEALAASPDLKREMDSDSAHQGLLRIALKLEGLVRQAGMHAAAVIIAPKAIVNFAPLFKQPGSDAVMIQYDKTYSEDIGLLKMDFLGLRNLSVIQDCLFQVERDLGLRIDPLQLPENDPKALSLLGKGLTVGVFQFESAGMQEYLKKLKPSNLEDMIAMNALYRPGPMDFIDQYIARKHGFEKVDCYHKNLEPILKETYGVIVYQEQVMQIAQDLSGFSLGGADLLRRAMAKKDEKKMNDLKPKFVKGAVERGYEASLAERIWDVLVPFSSYAFNKSHSAAYATIAYQTAYLKAHYAAYFMAANMNSEMHDTSRLVVLINDCKTLGLEVAFPEINSGDSKFTVSQGRILYGLGGIKNVGVSAVEKIVAEREKGGKFESLFDLCKRVDGHALNRRALESLIFAGALDMLPGNRAQQFAAVETALSYAMAFQNDKELGQTSLFELTDAGHSLDTGEPELPQVEAWPYNEMLEKEKEVLGLFLSGHPLEPYRTELMSFVSTTLDPIRLGALSHGANVILGGMVAFLKTRISSRDNKTFAFGELEDFFGKIEVVFWSDVFEEVRHLVEIDSMVLIRGTFQRNPENGSVKLVASKVLPLDSARERLAKSLHLKVKTTGLGKEVIEQIQSLCGEYQGDCQLVFHLECNDEAVLEMVSEGVAISPDRSLTENLEQVVGRGNLWLSPKGA